MKVDVWTPLDCSAAKAWDEVQKSALFLHIIWPLASVTPVPGTSFPERWNEGQTIKCKVALFGLIPIGTRTLLHEKIDQATREIVTHEFDPLIKRWDHRISIEPQGENRSIYRDTIEIDAGALTVLVWAWASGFYRYRQWRWRAVAKTL